MDRLCVWGDSITYGASDTEKGGWVNRLKIYFGGDDDAPSVYNVGISGDNTSNLVERFSVECKARNPDAILFAIGVNDSQHDIDGKFRVPLKDFRKNLRFLFEEAKKYTDKIGFIGLMKVDDSKVSPIPWNTAQYYDKESVLKFDVAIKEFCEENDLPYLYMYDLLGDENMPDGLHPDAVGHEKMFLRIKDFFEKEFVDGKS